MRASVAFEGADELAAFAPTGNCAADGRWQLTVRCPDSVYAWATATEALAIADAWRALAADLATREGSPGWSLAADPDEVAA